MCEVADREHLLLSLRRLLINHARFSMTSYGPRQMNLGRQQANAADQHDQFMELVAALDSDAAVALAVDHWELSRLQIESFFTPESIHMPLGLPPKRVA